MGHSWQFFLLMVFFCLVAQGFYAMLEMALISFNKVRLQYYASQNERWALWISKLVNHPARLFGTSLICINAALQLGSQCARQFYLSMGVSPDFAPLSQVVLVLVFAEIAPMFAGRRYAESAALLGIPFFYFSSLVLRPLIWLFDLLCKLSNRLLGSPGHGGLYLSREELQKILEEREDLEGTDEFNTLVTSIFSLKNKTAKEIMQPIQTVTLASSLCTVAQMRALLVSDYCDYVPIYHKSPHNIVAIAYPRDLLRLTENKRVREHARSAWFITTQSSIVQILKQFQRNKQTVAIVLDEVGLAVGTLTLDALVDMIFGRAIGAKEEAEEVLPAQVLVERTFPGDMKLSDFNERFHAHLEHDEAQTLEELMHKVLGHHPVKGESVRIEQFELIAEEPSLLGAKAISVRSIS